MCGIEYHKYTEAEREFMKQFVPGHSYVEIQRAFTDKFQWNISLSQISSYIKNHHLNTGRNGQYQKGNIPFNKGRKGECAAGCENSWFKKGNIPANHRAVGSERINPDGYIEIKVEEPNKWKMKHRLVWEQHNGAIPKGHIVIFRDNDKTNVDISNLLLISRKTNLRLNHSGLCNVCGEFKETAIGIAELNTSIANAKRRKRKAAERQP